MSEELRAPWIPPEPEYSHEVSHLRFWEQMVRNGFEEFMRAHFETLDEAQPPDPEEVPLQPDEEPR